MNRRTTIVICTVGVCLAAMLVVGCGGQKSPKVIPGTKARALPPLPADLVKDAYVADALYSKGCADVASGMNNCLDLLRRECRREMSRILRQDIMGEDITPSLVDVEGMIAEDREYIGNLVQTWSGSLYSKPLESPMFELSDGETLALRMMSVKAESLYMIMTDLAEKAASDGYEAAAAKIENVIKSRFGSKPPDRSKIEAVEARISEHYQELWAMTQRDR